MPGSDPEGSGVACRPAAMAAEMGPAMTPPGAVEAAVMIAASVAGVDIDAKKATSVMGVLAAAAAATPKELKTAASCSMVTAWPGAYPPPEVTSESCPLVSR